MNFQKDPNRLEVYTETRKSKILVGTLVHDRKTERFVFEYDRKYLHSKNAIPIGPEFPLKKPVHISKDDNLFSSFSDRIPSRENAAFEEYCLSQGISPSEKNPILLLTTIGRRGPSTFVFEAIYLDVDISQAFRFFRKDLEITLREFAAAFDMNLPTLSRIETGKSRDKSTLKLIAIYLKFPEVALWQLRANERKLHQTISKKLFSYFDEKVHKAKQEPSLPL